MGVTKEDVESALTSSLNPAHLEVVDTSGGCGASFEIEIVSEKFEGEEVAGEAQDSERCACGADETDSCFVHQEGTPSFSVETPS